MTDRKDDPDLSPEAALAEDIGDPVKRQEEQLSYLGGEKDPDIDDFDPSALDDGSDFTGEEENAAPPESPSDKDTEEEDTEDEEDEDEESVDESDSEDEEDADDDDSDEEEVEEEEDDEDEGDNAPQKKVQGIPKSRFDEVNERRKAAEAELEQLRAQQKAADESKEDKFDFVAAEKEYIQHVMDGDEDAAVAKRQEIDAAKHEQWKRESKTETRADLDRDAQVKEVQSLSAQAEGMFAEFNPESDNFEPAYVEKTLVFYQGYLAKGMTPGDAFVEAVADAVEMWDLKPIGEADDAPPPVKKTGKKKTGGKKKEEARKKAHQPVAQAGKGSAEAGAVLPDISQMSDEEIDALPEKTLARLRGDFV